MSDVKDDTAGTPADPVVSIFDICETDANAEEDGRWFRDVFGDGSNVDVKLRRLTSKPSMQVRRRLDKGFRKYLKNGVYPDAIAIEVLNRQVSEAVLIDWAGVIGRDGAVIPYTRDGALELLSKLPVFRDTILSMSQNLDNFRVEDQAAAVKN